MSKEKDKDGWRPFMVYLDPRDPDDREIINHLLRHKRRREISGEIRKALVLYMAYLRQRRKPEPDKPLDLNIDLDAPRQERQNVIEVSPTVNEAAHTFIKPRR